MNMSSGTIPQSSTSEAQGFNYEALDSETRIVVQKRTSEIKSLMRRTAQDMIDIGQKLIEIKERLRHGNFETWLKAEFEWGLWTARKFIQVAERFSSVNFTDMSIATSALYLLAAPSTPEEARQYALECASQGENITHSKAKTIVSQYKQSIQPKIPKDEPTPTEVVFTSPPTAPSLESQSELQVINASVVEVEDEAPGSASQIAEQRLREKVEPETPGVQDEQLEREFIEWVNVLPQEDMEVESKSQSEASKRSADRLLERIRIISIEREEFEQAEEVAQTFEITSNGVRIAIEVNRKAIITLFEQMGFNPTFAEEVFRQARLLSDGCDQKQVGGQN
ncbi:MAG: DUF3102 domain-containing protein [Xenococcaceae cyanobacterium]